MKLALPLPSATVARGVAPSINDTVPPGTPDEATTGFTVAVRVIDCPKTEGFELEATDVVVPILSTVRLKVLVAVP